MFEQFKFQSCRRVNSLILPTPTSVAAEEKWKEWHFGKECHLSEFSIGQYQITSEKLRRKSISVSQTVCPICSLQVNAGICMPVSPLEQLWICKLKSFLLLCSQSLLPHAHCLHSWLLSREGHLTTQTLLILKNWSSFVASEVYVKSVACVLSNTKS